MGLNDVEITSILIHRAAVLRILQALLTQLLNIYVHSRGDFDVGYVRGYLDALKNVAIGIQVDGQFDEYKKSLVQRKQIRD